MRIAAQTWALVVASINTRTRRSLSSRAVADADCFRLCVPKTEIAPRGPRSARCMWVPVSVGSAVEVGRSRGTVLSFLYWALRRLLELLVLRMRSEREKEIEIVVLRHQLRVLERQLARP
jgi:hypothetical protein